MLALLLLLPSPTLAKTSVTPFTASKLLVRAGGNAAPAVSVVGHGLIHITNAIAGDPRAGTLRAGAAGVAGATHTLPACAAGPCNDSYRGASTARLTVGHYAEWLEVSLLQPRRATGPAFGFSVELAVKVGTTWFLATGYFSSGTTNAAASQTVHVNLLVDLGRTTLPPTPLVEYAIGACATAASCP